MCNLLKFLSIYIPDDVEFQLRSSSEGD